jgi:hypothetical protein
MKFDPTKPVQMFNGTPARIICTDRDWKFPIVALVGHDAMPEVFDLHGIRPGGFTPVLVNIHPRSARYE